MKRKVRQVTEETVIDLNDDELESLLKKACGFPDSSTVAVEFDVGSAGYVRGVRLKHKVTHPPEDVTD